MNFRVVTKTEIRGYEARIEELLREVERLREENKRLVFRSEAALNLILVKATGAGIAAGEQRSPEELESILEKSLMIHGSDEIGHSEQELAEQAKFMQRLQS